MLALSDGLSLIQIAEDVADLGAVVLTPDVVATVIVAAQEPNAQELVGARLQDEAHAKTFLNRLIHQASGGQHLTESEEPEFVQKLAALGSLIVRSATEQHTGAFEVIPA